MSVNKISAFDGMAADYDATFSRSLTGECQRGRSRKWLSAFLEDKSNLSILEINCGTGDDALWLTSLGHEVIATDVSGAMIGEAKRKAGVVAANQSISFLRSSFDELATVLNDEKFDLVFSNFSGLNCISAEEMKSLNRRLDTLLKPGGHIAVVIFGKYSCWETIYYLLKMKPGKAFRRWTKKPSESVLKEGAIQPVYYYSISRFKKLLQGFRLIDKKPIGLFVPPSYMEGTIRKRPRFFSWLKRMERKTGNISAFSQLADHCYLLLKKK